MDHPAFRGGPLHGRNPSEAMFIAELAERKRQLFEKSGAKTFLKLGLRR
jgi:hypothetical protein